MAEASKASEIVTDMRCSSAGVQNIIGKFGAERVLVLAVLGWADLRRGA
jgi:hypothetical protein